MTDKKPKTNINSIKEYINTNSSMLFRIMLMFVFGCVLLMLSLHINVLAPCASADDVEESNNAHDFMCDDNDDDDNASLSVQGFILVTLLATAITSMGLSLINRF